MTCFCVREIFWSKKINRLEIALITSLYYTTLLKLKLARSELKRNWAFRKVLLLWCKALLYIEDNPRKWMIIDSAHKNTKQQTFLWLHHRISYTVPNVFDHPREYLNTIWLNVPFLYPLKTSENIRFLYPMKCHSQTTLSSE